MLNISIYSYILIDIIDRIVYACIFKCNFRNIILLAWYHYVCDYTAIYHYIIMLSKL